MSLGPMPNGPSEWAKALLAQARQTVRRQNATPEELGEAVEVLATSSGYGDQMIARRISNEAWATKGSEIVEGDNFCRTDAARVARLCCDMGQIAGDAESRSASRALGWWMVALLIVALCICAFGLGYGMVRFGAYVGAKTEATVAMAAERGAW
jgi:hypothetical protein